MGGYPDHILDPPLRMVVCDLHVTGSLLAPAEANPILPVDPNAILPRAIPPEGLEPISWRDPQVLKCFSVVNQEELLPSAFDHTRRAHLPCRLGTHAVEYVLGPLVPECDRHAITIAHFLCYSLPQGPILRSTIRKGFRQTNPRFPNFRPGAGLAHARPVTGRELARRAAAKRSEGGNRPSYASPGFNRIRTPRRQSRDPGPVAAHPTYWPSLMSAITAWATFSREACVSFPTPSAIKLWWAVKSLPGRAKLARRREPSAKSCSESSIAFGSE